MTLGFVFYLILIVCGIIWCVGVWGGPDREVMTRRGFSLVLFVLVLILGCKEFGWPIQSSGTTYVGNDRVEIRK